VVEYRPYGSSHNTVPTAHHTIPSLRLITQYRPYGSSHNTVPTAHRTIPQWERQGKWKYTKYADTRRAVFWNSALWRI